MTPADPEQRSRKLVEAVNLADHPVPLDVAAALIEAPTEETLELGEHLMRDGLVATSGDSFITGEAETDELTSVRIAYLYRELARSFTAAGYAERDPALVAGYLLKAGDADAALPLIDAAVTDAGTPEGIVGLIDAAIVAIEAEGLATELEPRLRVERAKFNQLAGNSDLAAADLSTAIRRLDGAARIDALGFLAAVEDNRQQSQQAEVYAASAIAEAAAIGEAVKAGSLSLLQTRILQRIGFPFEADLAQDKGSAALEIAGTPYQRWLAVQNRARIAFDRGRAIEAEPLFAQVFDRAADIAGPAAEADAAAWLARARFLRGHPSEGLESARAAIDLAEEVEIAGPIFLANMAEAEGAIRFAAYEQGLDAADSMLEYVLLQLPYWENAARYLRARALLGLGRTDDAAKEIEMALALCPEGVNGWRWRLRIEAFGLTIHAARGDEWPHQRAEDLTDGLLQGQWLDVAADLMAVRAAIESDGELARQSAALALQLGIPTTAAAAIEAGGLWSDPSSVVVVARIKETAPHVDPAWREEWSAQPEIAAALAATDVVDEQVEAASATLQSDLDAALIAAGLADPATTLSPAQRRAGGLVRRRPSRIRRGVLVVGAAAAVVFLAVGGGFLASRVFAESDMTSLAIEDTPIPVPEAFGKTWETLGGNQARTGVSSATGVSEMEGHYWVNEESASPFDASPIVLGQTVVVPSRDGDVYFMEQRDGSTARVWSTGADFQKTAAGVEVTAPSIAGGTSEYFVYLPGTDGFLYVFNVQSATEVDRLPIDTCCTPALDPATGLLWAGDKGGVLYTIDAANGDYEEVGPVEKDRLDAEVTTAITFDGGFLYFGMGNELWQFDVTERRAKRCDAVTENDFLTPVVSDGAVYAANQDRSVHTFDAKTCEWFRSINVGEVLRDAPAVVDGVVYQPHQFGITAYYYGTRDDVEALIGPDPDAKELVDDDVVMWRTVHGRSEVGAVNSSPVVAGDLLYVGAQNGHVYALDWTSSDLGIVWKWDARGRIANSVAVVDHAVYVATTGGRVIAIGGREGEALTIPTTTVPPVESAPGAG